MKHKRPDGKTIRPSLVVLDDPQTDESARSPSQCANREKILAGAVLGLAVSHATIHDHGGNIEVESSPAGTKFTISLPTASPSVSQMRIPVT